MEGLAEDVAGKALFQQIKVQLFRIGGFVVQNLLPLKYPSIEDTTRYSPSNSRARLISVVASALSSASNVTYHTRMV